MKHNYLDNIPLENAKEKFFSLLEKNGFCKKTQLIPTANSFGYITACAHYAKICSPHYNASSMDGIAVKSEMTFEASERNAVILDKSSYETVDTGDPIPDGKDAVIMIEDVIFDEDNAIIHAPAKPFLNVRQIGEDICMGDMLLPSFTKITPAAAGALLAGGITNARVIKKPVFGIIPTGDEIVSATDNPEKGEIIEFNSTVVLGILRENGADGKVYPIIPDKKELIKETLKKAAEECDAVILLAGSSAGRDDYTKKVIEELGEIALHGIAVKPGKPAVLGAIKDVPVIGLPGYPVSAIVIMNEITKPVIDFYYGKETKKKNTLKAVLTRKISSSLKYEEFIRVTLGKTGENFTAVPISAGAGVITSFTKADGILRIPQNWEGYEAGQTVDIELLTDIDTIKNRLIVTGSHDPLIDEIADIMRIKYPEYSLTSSHVGSMGAISAAKLNCAHLGGVHLLDEATGKYNESYINKYFPDKNVKLIKGVNRIQGLMVQKGNPLNIKEFKDIENVRYLNRQKGSGTRILCDYLLKKNNLDPEKISGYFNEEYTHTAVAAGVKNNNADAGLGIYSAALMYDLDFIPLYDEQYDFLVNENALETDVFKVFLEILESDEFKERLNKMGGYKI